MADREKTWFEHPRKGGASAGAGGDAAAPGDGALQALFEFDPASGVLSWSDPAAAARLLGAEGALASIERAAYSEKIVSGETRLRERAFDGAEQNYSCEYQIARDAGDRNADRHWVEERGGWLGAGDDRRLIGVVRSIESQKARDAHLAWLAENDELTGVMNRAQIRVRLDDSLSQMTATRGAGVYLLAGIDDVGSINADFGFDVADEVIVECSRRIASVVGAGDLVGRVAGTKFAIFVKDAGPDRVREICVRLLNVIRERVIETKKGSVAASISIGSVRRRATLTMRTAPWRARRPRSIRPSASAAQAGPRSTRRPTSSRCAAATRICRTSS